MTLHPSPSVEIVIYPDEGAQDNGVVLFVARDLVPDAEDAIERAVRQTDCEFGAERLIAEPMLLREIGEVEARISGYDPEMTGYLPCTSRARRAMPYWRVRSVPR